MNIWIIVYIVIAYLFIGMIFSAAIKAFIFDNDDDGEEGWKITTTLFWPICIIVLIFAAIIVLAGEFIDYLAKQFTKKED